MNTDNIIIQTDNIIIHTDGTRTAVQPEQDGKFSLEQLQKYVGGYIEVINLTEDRALVVNENGKYEKLSLNEDATALSHACHAIFPADYIVGDAVLLQSKLLD